jgi:hypothetical protein
MNLPAVPGGDDLVTPLNVLVGGQASPSDSGSQNLRSGVVEMKATRILEAKSSRVQIKSGAPEPYVQKAQEVLAAFFKRQRAVVLSRLGSKAAGDWWDAERWDSELSDDLYALSVTTATALGAKQAEAMGFDAGDYDEARTLKFLRAVADSRSSWINSATKSQIDAALEESEPDVGGVFDNAESARSESGAGALMASVAGFALVEAATQLLGEKAGKTWETGPNARPEHAAMDGETAGIGEPFSNGAQWPGDPVLGAEGVANCNCGVSISF